MVSWKLRVFLCLHWLRILEGKLKFLKVSVQKNIQLIITSLPIMAETIGNIPLDKYTKYLIIQIFAMIAGQECSEYKRW